MRSISLRHVKFHNPRLPHAASFTSSHHPWQHQSHPNIFEVSEEVYWGVADKKPVVALETTIYTHGFPYPDNVALASHLESVVRMNGGIPATIGVLHGVARVGLSPEELIELASAAGKTETMKISRRDLPYITGLVCFLFQT
jgi:pseudouridylate synthase / pseudouridine kinase